MRSHFYASQQGPIYGQDDSDHWLAEAEAGQSLPGGPAVSSASTGPSPVMLGPNKGTKSQIKDWQRFLVTQGYSIGPKCVDGHLGQWPSRDAYNHTEECRLPWLEHAVRR